MTSYLNTITATGSSNNTLSNEQRIHYSLELLSRLQNDVVFGQFGMKEDIPQNGGTKINKRRFEKLSFEQTPTAITEGVAPDADSVTVTKVEITPAQYGSWLKFTDKALIQSIDNLTMEFLKLIKEKAVDTNECVVRNPLLTGTQVFYAGGGVSREALDKDNKMAVADIKKGATLLRRKNAMGFGADKSYILIAHPDQIHDIKNDSNYIDMVKYRDPDKLYNGEVGKIDNVRIVSSNLVKVLAGAGAGTDVTGIRTTDVESTAKADVYQAVLLAEEAYMSVAMSGKSGNAPEVFSQLPTASIADPLAQVAFCAFKFFQASGIVDDNRMVRIESTASGF